MPQLVDPAIAFGSFARLSQPILDLNDFILRPWQESDEPAVVDAYAEPSIQHWHVRSMTEDEARVWIDSWSGRWSQERGGGWAIADSSGLLGQISLRQLSLMDGAGEVSYWVSHSTMNPASCYVAENAGYRLEGTKRRQGLHTDGWHDMHLHARLIDDPPVLS